MRYAGLIENDIVNGEGVCVSLFTQGCPHHCDGCFNSETWDRFGGTEINREELLHKIIQSIKFNDVTRNFSILGGEPLVDYNLEDVAYIIKKVRKAYPSIKIFLWTGYTIEELINKPSPNMTYVLQNIDVLIEGRYEKDKRDVTLKLRGSTNQRVLYSPFIDT